MTVRDLRIAPGLRLGPEFVTKTAAILAQRRKGKTYTGSVLAEEMVAAQMPFVALDPTGAWWGLRASADGKSEGLPVTILGGNHGDVPLDRSDGTAIADLVVEEPGYYVIDFNAFESGQAEKDFATDFAKRLYRRKGEQGMDFALHLFVDEADRFVPQRIRDKKEGDEAMLGAFETIVRRGGLRGLGTTLISQRAAVVNKNVLEMLDVLIVLRVVGPNDRKAIMEYASSEGTADQIAELRGSMASLGIGEAWVWEPGEGLFQRVQVRERRTFNSSATPKPGERRIEPRRLAPVELEAVRKRLAETLERQDAEDPVKLQQRIRELERQLRQRSEVAKIEEIKVPVEVPVVPEVVAESAEALSRYADKLRVMGTELSVIGIDLAKAKQKAEKQRPKTRSVPAPTGLSTNVRQLSDVRPPKSPKTGDKVGTGDKLPKGQKAVLTALAMYPEGRTQRQVALLCGYKQSGGFRNIIYALRGQGYLVGSPERLQITRGGADALGPFEPLPTGHELYEWWMSNGKLGKGGKAVLEHLVDIYPESMDQEDVADAVGYEHSGGFRNIIYRLRGLELIAGDKTSLCASEELIG